RQVRRRHQIDLTVVDDALVCHFRGTRSEAELIAQGGDLICSVSQTLLIAQDADDARVIGLYRKDAGGGVKNALVAYQCRRAVIGGDANILEDECAEEEVLFARERIKGVSQARCLRKDIEAVLEIDARLRD